MMDSTVSMIVVLKCLTAPAEHIIRHKKEQDLEDETPKSGEMELFLA